MFDINSVYLKDFKSFAGEHTFDLPTEPGLYFLTGLNRREPKLGSNGAGKSTLLDAIHWCLYGRTLRGLKAADVVTWGKQSCTVTVTLTLPTGQLQVTRGQNPNILAVDGDDHCIVTQEELDKRIGLNAGSFVYSVILPQFGQSFFELKPSEKLTLFSEIMNLDFWLEKSKAAAVLTGEISKEVDRTVFGIEATKDTINTLKNDIESLKKEEGSNEELRESKLKKLKAQINHTQQELDAINTRKTKLASSLEFWERDQARRVEELKRIRDARDNHNLNCSRLNADRTVLLEKIDEAEEALTKLSGLGATCPTCMQKVDGKHLQAEQRAVKRKIEDLRDEFEAADKKWRDASKFATKVSKDAAAYDEGLHDIINECHTISTKLGVLKERSDNVVAQINQLKADHKELAERANPYSSMVAGKKAALKQQDEKLANLNERLASLSAEYEATSYWVSGFKRLRLFIIEETLRSLELEVNNALASLGLVDWQVEFDVERENKSGGVTKGFVVFIKCPSHPEPVRWESWSGGETQRLQLAGDFGLANLIMMEAGLTNSIEFYDEPSDHLSDEGLVDLAETLQQRAMNENKRIILVDHRMPDFGDFTGIIVVEKDKTGSHIKKDPVV